MLTPAARRALVWAPFPVVQRHTTSYPHGGTLIDRSVEDAVSLRRKLERGESLTPNTLDEVAVLFGE